MKNLIKRILKEEQDLNWAQETVSGEIRPTRSLVIKKQTNNPKNAIQVDFEIMYGDADSYERNSQIFVRYPKNKWEPNFDDFEEMVNFLKTDRGIEDLDEDLREKFSEYGLIGYSEHFGDDWEMGSIEDVYYYDDMGNKYDAKIDGVSTNGDYEDDEEEDDEDDDDYDDLDEDDLEGNGETDEPRVVRWNIPD